MYRSVRVYRGTVFLSISFSVLMIALFLLQPSIAVNGVKHGLEVCASTIIPALFPFIFFVDYLFQKLCCYPKISRSFFLFFALLFGLVGGFPMGSKALADLCNRGMISKKRAAVFLSGSVNAGPAFLIGGVGLGLFRNLRAGMILFAALSAASAIILLLFSFLFHAGNPFEKETTAPIKPIIPSFTESMSFALGATLKLCGFIVLFTCFGAYAEYFLAALQAPVWLHWLSLSLIEVVNGCRIAADIGSVTGILLAGASISLCSASIIFQIQSLLKCENISLRYFLWSRPLHTLITVWLLKIQIPLFPQAQNAFAADIIHKIYNFSPLFSLFFILISVIFVLGDTRKPLFTGPPK